VTISIIIATYNREHLLDDCLSHLAKQRFAQGDEVIVVDNGSTDDTPVVIARHAQRFEVPLHHLEERQPGKSHALASAVVAARGDVLAFTDDDVNVDAGWLDAIRTAMAGTMALVGGPVAPRWEHRPPPWLEAAAAGYGRLTAPLALLNYGPRALDLGARTALGANLAVRRDVFGSVGGFSPHLGKLRGTLLSGEDHDLCRRVQAAGFRAMYCPDVRVRHWVPVDRMRVRYYLAWFFWSGITNAALDAAEPRQGRWLFGAPLCLVRQAATAAVAAAGAAIVGNATGAMERVIEITYAAGYVARCWGFASAHEAAVAAGGHS
jgi:glycosyltransferase involved in cell wall biosynthesis